MMRTHSRLRMRNGFAFSPLALFTAGEQGAWYDPNDLSTLFQDSAGTTPVTAAGQPVGLMLDKRLSLAAGVDQRANGVTGIAGVATAATYSTSTGDGSVNRAGDVNNQSYVQFSGLVPFGIYAITLSGISGSGLARSGTHTSPTTQALGVGSVSTMFQASSGGQITITAAAVAGTTYVFAGLSMRMVAGNHAFQATAASRPTLRLNATTGAYYLETDGIDDFMLTNSIDFTGTDKVSVFTGVRKLSDAASAVLVEFGTDSVAVNGSFGILAPSLAGANSYRLQARGTITQSAGTGVFAAAPDTSVLGGSVNISGDAASLRRNGAVVQSVSGDLGAGNLSTYPLYLFRRAGTSLPFGGHFYGLIIVGRLTTDIETRNSELMLANRTGVVLA